MSVAVGVEIIFAAVAVGIYLAFIQALRFAPPRWLANLVIGVGLSGVLLMLDYSAHRHTGMHRMQASMIFLGFWSSFASLFNVFIMRRGVWLVGKQSEPLWRDLARMPEVAPELLKRMSSKRIFSTLLYPNTLAGCLLLLLPPHDPSHSVETPSTIISPSTRMPRRERRREPNVNMIPSSPGSKTA